MAGLAGLAGLAMLAVLARLAVLVGVEVMFVKSTDSVGLVGAPPCGQG